ncbi:MAG: VOC family protein [Bacteroidota bacterium]
MTIDHIFICSSRQGEEANELVEFGLTEGSSRVHPGQGTTNRKFYFDNFFLEILWAHDKGELKGSPTAETRLWERIEFRESGAARFGLCLVNTPETDPLFSQAHRYQPQYFPEGMAIDVCAFPHQLSLPWTFRLPFKGQKKKADEPREHPKSLEKLTKAIFQLPRKAMHEGMVQQLDGSSQIAFCEGHESHLGLVFDEGKRGEECHFPALALSIYY